MEGFFHINRYTEDKEYRDPLRFVVKRQVAGQRREADE